MKAYEANLVEMKKFRLESNVSRGTEVMEISIKAIILRK